MFLRLKNHIFCFFNKNAPLFKEKTTELQFDFFVAWTYLSDDEIQEHNAGHDNHEKPGDPKNPVLKIIKVGCLVKIEVSKRNPDNCEQLSHPEWKILVLLARIGHEYR